MKKYNLHMVDSKNIYGTMNTGTIRLSNMTNKDKEMIMVMHQINEQELKDYELTKEDKSLIFKNHRKALGDAFGFDWTKMFMADQVKKDGSYFEITEDYVKANPNGWTDIPEDILIITDKVPGVVIGHPVADCPVIIMEDNKQGVCAMAHCSAELIDKKMPMMIADALQKAYQTNDEDIIAYVSACAGDSWTYDNYPKWATDSSLWETGIIEDKDGVFHIDLRKVIKKELQDRNIFCSVYFNDDTITNKNYYSNAAASPYGLNDQTRFGRNFMGALYCENSIKQKSK